MPRGGFRANAGRKADPNSERQKKLAKKTTTKKAPKAKAAPKKDRGLTLPSGQKSPDAPPGWPFGTAAPPEVPEAPPTEPDVSNATPLEYLLLVMRDKSKSESARLQAAIQAAPYMHAKPAPGAKKEDAADRAKKAAGGKFKAAPPPLKLVGKK